MTPTKDHNKSLSQDMGWDGWSEEMKTLYHFEWIIACIDQ